MSDDKEKHIKSMITRQGLSPNLVDAVRDILAGKKVDAKVDDEDAVELQKQAAEALDPVSKKELQGTHAQRKDKDIDNDGKVTASDRYLHRRRKIIMKKLSSDKTMGNKTMDEAVIDHSDLTKDHKIFKQPSYAGHGRGPMTISHTVHMAHPDKTHTYFGKEGKSLGQTVVHKNDVKTVNFKSSLHNSSFASTPASTSKSVKTHPEVKKLMAKGYKIVGHDSESTKGVNEEKTPTDAQLHKTLGPTKNMQQGIEALKKKHGMTHDQAKGHIERLIGQLPIHGNPHKEETEIEEGAMSRMDYQQKSGEKGTGLKTYKPASTLIANPKTQQVRRVSPSRAKMAVKKGFVYAEDKQQVDEISRSKLSAYMSKSAASVSGKDAKTQDKRIAGQSICLLYTSPSPRDS